MRVLPHFKKERMMSLTLAVAKLKVYTTDKQVTTLELEYHKEISSPLLLAERVKKEGFTKALDNHTMLYSPAAVIKVVIERSDPDPGR